METRPRRIAEFVDIQATGTPVVGVVERAVGLTNVYIYSPEADRLSRSSDRLPLKSPLLDKLRAAFSHPIFDPIVVNLFPIARGIYRERFRSRYPVLEVPEDARVVAGQFTADKFDNMIEGEPLRGVVIRNPLDRMYQHYDEWKRNKGYDDSRIHIPYKHGMRFEEFALLPQLKNYQTHSLAGKDIATFDVVGVTERIDEFAQAFLKRLAQEGLIQPDHEGDFQRSLIKATVGSSGTPLENLNPKFLSQFREFHAQDYSLYERAATLQQQRSDSK